MKHPKQVRYHDSYHCFQASNSPGNQGRVEASALLVESLSRDTDQHCIFVRSGNLLPLRRDAPQVATA